MLTPTRIGKERYARTRMPGTPQGQHRRGRAARYEGTNREEQKDHRGKAQHNKKQKKKKKKKKKKKNQAYTRDTRVAEPWLHAPEDERPGKGQRLTPGAPHNGGRHPPRGRPSATPTASNGGPQGRTLRGRCWVHTPASTAPGTHGSQNPGCALQRTSGRGRDSA